MPRRKKGRPVHGWLILDKPLKMTSTEAVGKVKRLFDAQKAGHAGTLDPLATGVLPLALGEATKTVSFAMDGEKSYRFSVRWGVETTTDDSEGDAAEVSERRPDIVDIEAALADFRGPISQIPPRYSAIKIDGNRAYDLARDGEQVELEPREVVINRLDLIRVEAPDTAVFEAECGKGTYVRAIARDLGRKLGCFGHVCELRRTRVGPFAEAGSWSLEQLSELGSEASGGVGLEQALLPVEAVLTNLPHLSLTSSDAVRVARGQGVILRGRDAPILTGAAYATHKGRLLALVEVARGELRPTRVFNLGH
ncbi:MAG: tRNA pseudouridine(55) synthase TruB [Hyphomicrobiaceae bacterium]